MVLGCFHINYFSGLDNKTLIVLLIVLFLNLFFSWGNNSTLLSSMEIHEVAARLNITQEVCNLR